MLSRRPRSISQPHPASENRCHHSGGSHPRLPVDRGPRSAGVPQPSGRRTSLIEERTQDVPIQCVSHGALPVRSVFMSVVGTRARASAYPLDRCTESGTTAPERVCCASATWRPSSTRRRTALPTHFDICQTSEPTRRRHPGPAFPSTGSTPSLLLPRSPAGARRHTLSCARRDGRARWVIALAGRGSRPADGCRILR